MSEPVHECPQLGALASQWLGADMSDPFGSPWPAVDAAMASLDADALFAEIDATHAIRGSELSRSWFGLGAHFHPALAGFAERGGDDGVTSFLDEVQQRYWPRTWWGQTASRLADTVPSLDWSPGDLDASGSFALVGSLGCRFATRSDELPASHVEAFLALVEALVDAEEPVATLVCTGLLEAIDNHAAQERRGRLRAAMGPRSRAYLEDLDDWPAAPTR